MAIVAFTSQTLVFSGTRKDLLLMRLIWEIQLFVLK